MDQKSKNTIKFTDFQLYKDYSSNQKSLSRLALKIQFNCKLLLISL